MPFITPLIDRPLELGQEASASLSLATAFEDLDYLTFVDSSILSTSLRSSQKPKSILKTAVAPAVITNEAVPTTRRLRFNSTYEVGFTFVDTTGYRKQVRQKSKKEGNTEALAEVLACFAEDVDISLDLAAQWLELNTSANKHVGWIYGDAELSRTPQLPAESLEAVEIVDEDIHHRVADGNAKVSFCDTGCIKPFDGSWKDERKRLAQEVAEERNRLLGRVIFDTLPEEPKTAPKSPPPEQQSAFGAFLSSFEAKKYVGELAATPIPAHGRTQRRTVASQAGKGFGRRADKASTGGRDIQWRLSGENEAVFEGF